MGEGLCVRNGLEYKEHRACNGPRGTYRLESEARLKHEKESVNEMRPEQHSTNTRATTAQENDELLHEKP